MAHVEIAQRSARGSLSLFLGNLGSTAISFFAIVFIARYLGPSQYGLYSLALLVPGLLLNLLGLGVNSGISRYAAYNLSQGRPEVARRMTLNGAAFILIFGLVLSALCFAFAGPLAQFVLHRDSMTPLVEFASLVILAQAVYQSGTSALLGWSQMGRMATTAVAQSAVRLFLAVLLILAGYALYGALAAYFLSVSLGGLMAFLLLRRSMTGRGSRTLEGFAGDVGVMLRYGRELFLGQFAASVSPQYVLAVLAVIASNAYVGYYQSAANFATIITLTSSAITTALFPAFAHLEGTGSDLGRAFAHATKYMGFILAPLVFLIAGASRQIVDVALGSSYSASSGYLALLALSNVALLFGYGVLPSFFGGAGRPRLYTVSSLAGVLVLLGLAPALGIVLRFGITGLILSVLVANVITTVVGLLLASRFAGAGLDVRACLSTFFSSLIAFAVVYGLSLLEVSDFLLLPVQVAGFAVIYLTCAPLLGAIGDGDLDIIESAISGLGGFRTLVRPLIAYEREVLRTFRRSEAR